MSKDERDLVKDMFGSDYERSIPDSNNESVDNELHDLIIVGIDEILNNEDPADWCEYLDSLEG